VGAVGGWGCAIGSSVTNGSGVFHVGVVWKWRSADIQEWVILMLSEGTKTRIEHQLDARSVAFGVWLYRVTRGRITRLWHRRAIVLTTVGRRSGRPRTVIVQVFHDGTDLLVVAANSGLPQPPGWYFNLMAHPSVVGELDGRRLQLHAEPLCGAEAADRWYRVVLPIAPDYEKYARRRGTIPPIFRLSRA
jgi:deazaflavin-dependent oxidoreductase (nitroreductase family)